MAKRRRKTIVGDCGALLRSVKALTDHCEYVEHAYPTRCRPGTEARLKAKVRRAATRVYVRLHALIDGPRGNEARAVASAISEAIECLFDALGHIPIEGAWRGAKHLLMLQVHLERAKALSRGVVR